MSMAAPAMSRRVGGGGGGLGVPKAPSSQAARLLTVRLPAAAGRRFTRGRERGAGGSEPAPAAPAAKLTMAARSRSIQDLGSTGLGIVGACSRPDVILVAMCVGSD